MNPEKVLKVQVLKMWKQKCGNLNLELRVDGYYLIRGS